jgi:Uma2 family endonuclease
MKTPRYIVDPEDPKAPPQEVWEAMTPEEREQVVASLPPLPDHKVSPPEGTQHFNAKVGALQTLDAYFKRVGRKVFLAAELSTYYPGHSAFAPDLLAVLDVEPGDRTIWSVQKEGRGLDFVLEVHVGGDRKKDAEVNVARYAQFGIPEYFIYDRQRLTLTGYRLPSPKTRQYKPILGQQGTFHSDVLGLDLVILDGRLRFLYAEAVLPEKDDIIARVSQMAQAFEEKYDEEARLRTEEAQRREEAERRVEAERGQREAAEKRIAELEAEIARLKKQ